MKAHHIFNIDDHRPHLTIATPGKVHVIPLALMEDLAAGRRAFQDVDDWEPILRTIVSEWLSTIKEVSREGAS